MREQDELLFPDDQQTAAPPRPGLDGRHAAQAGRRRAARDRRHPRPLRRHQAACHRRRHRVRADPARTQRKAGSNHERPQDPAHRRRAAPALARARRRRRPVPRRPRPQAGLAARHAAADRQGARSAQGRQARVREGLGPVGQQPRRQGRARGLPRRRATPGWT